MAFVTHKLINTKLHGTLRLYIQSLLEYIYTVYTRSDPIKYGHIL